MKFAIVFSLFVAIIATDSTMCKEFGYEEDLSCSTCSKVKQFTRDEELVKICEECCKEDKEEIKKAQRVVLTIGQYNERAFPHITEFIQNHANKFPQFTHRNLQFASPRLELFDSNNQLIDLVRIDHWETDDIIEFLTKTLQSDS